MVTDKVKACATLQAENAVLREQLARMLQPIADLAAMKMPPPAFGKANVDGRAELRSLGCKRRAMHDDAQQ